MTRALRSPRRAAAVLLLLVLSVAAFPAGVLGQADDGAATGSTSAILSQDGWWNRAQGPQEGEPGNPLRPIIGGTVPAPSTVPANAIAVGAVLGEPDKVAAVGFVLDAPMDAFVDRLVLTLKESTASNANANAAGASIIACPITGFWASVKNGDFASRPSCDESQSVPGTRAPDGTWSFDLSLLAAGWLDGSLMQNGVLLREAVEPPTSFQVSFDDLSTGRITLDFAASGGGFSGSSDFLFEEPVVTEDFATSDPGTTDFGVDPSSSFDSGTTFDAGGSSFSSSSAPSVSPPAAAAPVQPQVATPVSGTVPTASTSLGGNLPVPALLFLFVLVLAGALFLGLVLGPLAAPAAAPTRSGGVSRALAARSAVSVRR